MRYTRLALLTFGAGLLLGLVVVAANLSGVARIASLAMAAGVVLLPFALIADWWRHRPWNDLKPKPKARATKKRAASRQRPRPKSSPPRKRGPRGK